MVVEHIRRYASTGYVRNQLIVLNDGGNGATALKAEASGTAASELAGAGGSAEALAVETVVTETVDIRLERVREARLKGYEGDPCDGCGNFTLVRNGTCMKCVTCGATSGCS